MSLQNIRNSIWNLILENSTSMPDTFAAAIAHVKTVVWQEFEREVTAQQLVYHTREHVEGVQRRAATIFQVVRPYWQAGDDVNRMEQLLDLCAIAHDLIQIFVPQVDPHTPRRREAGVSEIATIQTVSDYIQSFNQWMRQNHANDAVQFTDTDRQIIQEAIAATICDYDPAEQAIFQPALYNRDRPLSPVARILALADIGALGMEGIEAYNREGRLLFLEENPDVLGLLQNQQLVTLPTTQPALAENIRQRLLKRARFQVCFAKSRLKRSLGELEGLPLAAIPALAQQVFRYLTPSTIQAIDANTPTKDTTSFESLLTFFEFDQVLDGAGINPI